MTDDLRPWTYQEAADWFSRDVRTIKRWVREGRLDRLGVGGLVTAESVRRLSTLPAGGGPSETQDRAAADGPGRALGG